MCTHPRYRLGTTKRITWLNCQYWQEKKHNICIPLRQSNAVYTYIVSTKCTGLYVYKCIGYEFRYCREQRQSNVFYLILSSNDQNTKSNGTNE